MNRTPGTYRPIAVMGKQYNAFIPNPLPPRMRLSAATERAVEEATRLFGRVDSYRDFIDILPVVGLLHFTSLRREALASSTIEGTITTPEALLRFETSGEDEGDHSVREVANYRAALQWGLEELDSRPLTVEFIRNLHARLMFRVRGASGAGEFKRNQNAIGSGPDDTIDEAVYIPPPPEATLDLMYALERYINSENDERRVVQVALVHYQFESIHPFSDGNGRVGRLLIVLQLIQTGLIRGPMIYPSVYFERNRQAYYHHLQSVREGGDWDAWVRFFAEGMIQQAKHSIELSRTVLALRDEIYKRVAGIRRRASVAAVLDAFFSDPIPRVADIMRISGIKSPHTVQVALQALQEQGLVVELSGKLRGRQYACKPLLDVAFS
ncbi:MAG: Fic family protein [Fimbriimonadia bacterium]|jgi:Fic family protein